MMKKLALAALFASLIPVMSQAQIAVRIGPPPPPVVEHYGPPPRAGYVWANGYQRWDGNRYAWAPGRWMRPPRRGAEWVPDRYERWHGGYRHRPGHWR